MPGERGREGRRKEGGREGGKEGRREEGERGREASGRERAQEVTLSKVISR